jgi:hypothetical protein
LDLLVVQELAEKLDLLVQELAEKLDLLVVQEIIQVRKDCKSYRLMDLKSRIF